MKSIKQSEELLWVAERLKAKVGFVWPEPTVIPDPQLFQPIWQLLQWGYFSGLIPQLQKLTVGEESFPFLTTELSQGL